MKNSKIVQSLREGDTVFTAKINTSCPRAVSIAAQAGFSCVWLDMEHVPSSISQIESQICAANAAGAEAVVRVPRGSYSDLIRPLELGATAIMVPHVFDVEETRSLVRQVKFHPLGRRPLDGGNADNEFGANGSKEYTMHANRNTLLILQIEDPEAMDVIDDIAAVPGLDMLFFGPGDFAHALGVAGQYDDPRVREAGEKLAASARKHGKLAGTVSLGNDIPRLRDLGFQLINVACDVAELRQGLHNSYLAAQRSLLNLSEKAKDSKSENIVKV